ncbi:MAG: thiamine phosphate synthase [Planctomycetaceae bacterium]|jgi:thiamine-phosphate pyrophosphorylase|nr:thiamine phosphate synthase [Planctomycetaceae bacterium]
MDNNESIGVLRIIDANANRAAEALRTIEEYVRFVVNDAYMSQATKSLRHRLATIIQLVPLRARSMARESQFDVGRDLTAAEETERANILAVVAAAFGRLKQALRCLEEYSKTMFSDVAELFEQLRYDAYQLEKMIVNASSTHERLVRANVYAIVDGQGDSDEFSRRMRALCAAGVDVIQLRDKNLNDKVLLERAMLLRHIMDAAECTPLMIMNDRPDLAVLSQADGVHVGQAELSVEQMRRIVGVDSVIGVSTHSLGQVKQAVIDGANYIGCGPVFASETKEFDKFPGVEFLRQVVDATTMPAFAIGGISLDNIGEISAVGFTRVAVSACLTNTEDVTAMVSELKVALDPLETEVG